MTKCERATTRTSSTNNIFATDCFARIYFYTRRKIKSSNPLRWRRSQQDCETLTTLRVMHSQARRDSTPRVAVLSARGGERKEPHNYIDAAAQRSPKNSKGPVELRRVILGFPGIAHLTQHSRSGDNTQDLVHAGLVSNLVHLGSTWPRMISFSCLPGVKKLTLTKHTGSDAIATNFPW